MSLRLIYGKSGCGKSEYCFKEIAKNVNKEKIYMIFKFKCLFLCLLQQKCNKSETLLENQAKM